MIGGISILVENKSSGELSFEIEQRIFFFFLKIKVFKNPNIAANVSYLFLANPKPHLPFVEGLGRNAE